VSARDRSKVRYVLLASKTLEIPPVRNAIRIAGNEAGAQMIWIRESEPTLFSSIDRSFSHITRADLIIAEISNDSSGIFYEIGFAHAIGKPIILLINKEFSSIDKLPMSLMELSNFIPYENTANGYTKIQKDLTKLIKDYIRNPQRFQRTSRFIRGFPDSQFVDIEIDKLEPREFENLCFELLTQMRFRRVEWGKALREVDVVATLPKKDPDGFEYQELWLISLGLNVPPEYLLNLLGKDLEYFVYHIFRGSKDIIGTHLNNNTPITILFIIQDQGYASFIEKEIKQVERRLGDSKFPVPMRTRIWDKQKLIDLIQSYPQLAVKYFSEGGRAQSSYRKSHEDLLRENAALNERLQVANERLKTTNKALEEERDKRARAERDAVWKDVAFKAAHKLGNPIFALETNLQGVKKRIAEGSDDALAVAEEMGTSIEKAKGIIEQFKSLTKAQEMSPQPVDIRSVLCSSSQVASENGVDVNIVVPEKCPKVFVDQNRINESFDELISNAMQWFDKEPKVLNITVSTTPKRALPESLNPSLRFLKIRFEDNGCGISDENKRRIFAPFYTTHPHGTGLGLSLVQRIIEGHSGLIQETGKIKSGAAFEIYLPIVSKTQLRGENNA
jgi:signal transduction histidine kinase/nucleoside 2-deoxyribosyltransferase